MAHKNLPALERQLDQFISITRHALQAEVQMETDHLLHLLTARINQQLGQLQNNVSIAFRKYNNGVLPEVSVDQQSVDQAILGSDRPAAAATVSSSKPPDVDSDNARDSAPKRQQNSTPKRRPCKKARQGNRRQSSIEVITLFSDDEDQDQNKDSTQKPKQRI